jgi:diguanylate cyclase (GGDEF)-like protein
MLDVDYFKRFNDAYGHVAGDQCLRAVAQAVAGRARRAGEMAARYGGEEFAVILPHTDIDAAVKLAEVIAQSVRDLHIPHKESAAAPHVTLSIGAAAESSCRLIARRCSHNIVDLRAYSAHRGGGPCALSGQDGGPQSGDRNGRRHQGGGCVVARSFLRTSPGTVVALNAGAGVILPSTSSAPPRLQERSRGHALPS